MAHELRTRTELKRLFAGPQPGSLNMLELLNSVAMILDDEVVFVNTELEDSEPPDRITAIRTLGYAEGGDVGGALYKRVDAEPGHPGKIKDALDNWWEIAEAVLRPAMFGATGDATADDTTAIQNLNDAAEGTGAAIQWPEDKRYKVSQITAAEASIWHGTARFRLAGTLTGSDIDISIGDNSRLDALNISTPGTETNSWFLSLGENVNIGRIDVEADSQRVNAGITCNGQDLYIGYLRTVNIDRPIVINGAEFAQTATTGSHIGFIECHSYRRGIVYFNHHDFVLGGHFMRDASPNEPATINAGDNGVRTSGCSDYFIGDGFVHEAGEHAYRIGGFAGVNEDNGKWGNLTAIRPRASAFKCNPLGSPDSSLVRDLEIASVTGIDCGRGNAGLGKTPDFLRFTNARDVRIGWAEVHLRDEIWSCTAGLTLNDVDGFWCGNLHVDTTSGRLVVGDESRDETDGPVNNVQIGTLTGSTTGTYAIDFIISAGIENIVIHNIDVTGFTSGLLIFNASTVVNGAVHVQGRVSGAISPTINSAPARDDAVLDLVWGKRRYFGRMDRVLWKGADELSVDAIDITNTTPTGLYLNAIGATSGEGNYGAGLEFSRPGSGRRGSAVASKQTGPSVWQMGTAVFVASPGISSSDAIYEAAVFTHVADLEFAIAERGPVIKSPDGTKYRIVVDNTGTLSTVAA